MDTSYPEGMGIQRGTGRTALVEAAAAILLRGDEVRITDVAAAAGVSHTLIYRHFPAGGKDELVAEACALLFRGLADGDFEAFAELTSDPVISSTFARGPGSPASRQQPSPEQLAVFRERLVEFEMTLLNPRRTPIRMARLQALLQAQTNPFVAERVDAVRRALVHDLAALLQRTFPDLTPADTTSLSILAQSMPLGVTAIAGGTISRAQRANLAAMWADMLISTLARNSPSQQNP